MKDVGITPDANHYGCLEVILKQLDYPNGQVADQLVANGLSKFLPNRITVSHVVKDANVDIIETIL